MPLQNSQLRISFIIAVREYYVATLYNSVVGLVVRISAFQADGPGSIPGRRTFITLVILASSTRTKLLSDGLFFRVLRWSSGYDACFTRRRSAVRSRHEVNFDGVFSDCSLRCAYP